MQAIDFAIDPDTPHLGHVLLGTVSATDAPDTWQAFEDFRSENPGLSHPLDSWGRASVEALCSGTDLTAHYPDDLPVFPLISEAMRLFPTLHQSPLGLLVSTRFGLMFGIRALLSGPTNKIKELAIEFGWELSDPADPCAACLDKLCLSACPVKAFDVHGFDYPACLAELAQQQDKGSCWQGGCLARAACPHSSFYSAEQTSFHHRAALESAKNYI